MACESYEIGNDEVLLEWAEGKPQDVKDAVADWLADVAKDPVAAAYCHLLRQGLPHGLDAYTAWIVLAEVFVDYTVIEDRCIVWILRQPVEVGFEDFAGA